MPRSRWKAALAFVAMLALVAVGLVSLPPSHAQAADRTLPLRAAFMYPWYPETWEAGQHFTPTAGLYDSGTQATVDRQIDQAQYGGLDAFITSFWGAGTPTAQRLPLIAQEAAAKSFAVTAYYEPEGTADPTVAQIQTDLAAIPSTSPGYLHIGGKPVLFVYNANDTTCAIVDKYRQAAPGWYLNLKVFPGYATCASQPDSWHQYGPATGYDQQGTFSAAVSPGFFAYNEATPRLARDLTRFTNDLTTMKNSGAQWQLVTTFNEWGEGTSVEPANEWASPSGFGTYLDAMHNLFGSTAPAPPVTVTSNPVADSYVASDLPTANNGTASTLRLDASPVDNDYFKFNVTGLAGQAVAKATLRLYVGQAGTTPIDVRKVADTAWTETGITYGNAPAASGTAVSHPTTGAGYVDFDVTSMVTGEGLTSFQASTTTPTNRAVTAREGVNKPQLVVTGNGGGTPPPPPANTAPTASFTSSVNALAVSVNGSASSDAEGPISSYAWTFGDGSTGTGVTASHTYAAAGTYNVKLTVTDSGGLTGTVTHAVTVASAPPPPPPANAVTKVLVIVEENHSLAEMQSGMPYDFSLAQQYGYATNYKGITHPSLPNYLAMAGGTTAGVTDDNPPSSHPINASSVFGQAITAGGTAKTYAESMTSNCQLTSSGNYAVKHNPWAYYTPSTERTPCQSFDVPETALAGDITAGALPTVGMVVPNLCNDAHDCSLATADNWLKTRMQEIFAGPDWQSGHLAVIITADEDDSSQSNLVLTTVVHPSQSGHVVSTALNHYSLTRLMEDVAHTSHLANAATAADMASAFGLPIAAGGGTPPGAAPNGPSGTWASTFDDEFNGTSLDTARWAPNWYGEGGSMNGVGTYAHNVSESNGALNLVLESASAGALVHTDISGGYRLPVGSYAEARIFFPGPSSTVLSNWDAWWASAAAADGWPSSGEHDIAEILSGTLTVNYHSPSGAHNQGAVAGFAPGNSWHTYGLYRGAGFADVYWDGVLVKHYTTDDSGKPEILILNTGNGSNDAFGLANAMRVDYVRAWQPA